MVTIVDVSDLIYSAAAPSPPAVDIDPRAVRLLPDSPEMVGLRFDADGYLVVAFPSEPTPERTAKAAAAAGVPVRPEVHDAWGFDELVRLAGAARGSARAPGAESILDTGLELGASDIHLLVGTPPIYRVGGVLRTSSDIGEISSSDMASIAEYIAPGLVDDSSWKGDLDSAISYRGWRMRVSLFRQRQNLSAVLRIIPGVIPPLDSLGVPEVVSELAKARQGLILLAGPTGSGKSTTLAALIDQVNTTSARHIITIEDPIEYLHASKLSTVRQREVGDDTASFAMALRAALRQDPDVILVGEMRDLETIETTLIAAETGHLVFSTVHANDSQSVIERIVDVFPPSQQAQIRTQLAATLLGAVTQSLVEAADAPGKRHLVCEVMVSNSAVRNHIRSGDTHQIHNDLITGIEEWGMLPFDLSLAQAVAAGKIAPSEAEVLAHNRQELDAYRSATRQKAPRTLQGLDGSLA